MTRRNLNVMGNALVNTFKFTANATMAMLFVAFLTACSSEDLNYHPTQASKLMGSMNEANGLGWATVDVEANATDINGDNIYANAHVRYECDPEVYVESEEELGLPVSLSLNNDGTIATGDGNKITRSESHSASKGVTLNIAGPDLSKGGTLGELTSNGDTLRREIVVNPGDAAFATADLPESFTKEWRNSKTSVVKYYRVYVKKAAPVVAQYRLRPQFVEVDGGYAYFNIYAEKSIDNGATWSEMDRYIDFVGMRYGTWKPNVSSQLVSSYDFTTNDKPVPMTADEGREGLGESKNFDVINLSKVEYRWGATFAAPADADGKTEREINGAQVVWVYGCVYHNPETGEPMPLNFTGEAKTTTNEVDKNTGIYTRVVSLICNGQTIDTQTGSVQLEIQ